MPDRILISGYYGFENFGDELILGVLTHSLKSWGLMPVVLSGNPRETQSTYEVESLQRTEVQNIWRTMARVQAFISGGGGLFQDVTGPGSPVYYGGLMEMAHWRKLPIAVFGQGVGPLRLGISRWLTRRAFGHASLVVVRDLKSQTLVEQLTGQRPELMADPVWLWEPNQAMRSAPQSAPGISLRPWPDLDQEALTHLANELARWPDIQETGVNLVDCQAGADIIPLGRLEQLLKQRNIPCHWYSQGNALYGIAHSKALIGMRYHALLIAAQLGIPSTALAYDPKVTWLASQLKIPYVPVTEIRRFSLDIFKESLCLPDPDVVKACREQAAKGFMHLKKWLRR